MLQEHHHISQNGMQRNARLVFVQSIAYIPVLASTYMALYSRIGMQQMGPPPNQRTPMLMSMPATGV